MSEVLDPDEVAALREVAAAARQYLMAELGAVHAKDAWHSYQDRFVKRLVPANHVDLAKHAWEQKERLRLAARSRLITAVDAAP